MSFLLGLLFGIWLCSMFVLWALWAEMSKPSMDDDEIHHGYINVKPKWGEVE